VKLDRECKGSQAYVALAGEILSRNGRHRGGSMSGKCR